MSWAQEEMGRAALGDARRSRRLVKLVKHLAEQPSLSIPAVRVGAAETKVAYRLLSHEAVGWSSCCDKSQKLMSQFLAYILPATAVQHKAQESMPS